MESAWHLLLLNKHKKFENDAIARFCCIDGQSKKWKEKKPTATRSRPITRLTESNLSVNNKEIKISEEFNIDRDGNLGL